MSMLKSRLSDFIVSTPSCLETAELKIVLDIFLHQQCASVVIVDEQQCPKGLLNSARTIPQLLSTSSGEISSSWNLYLEQPLNQWGQGLVEPVKTLMIGMSVEEFRLFLGSIDKQNKTNLNLAVVDTDGKYLGLVDFPRLLQSFMQYQATSTKSSKSISKKKTQEKVPPVEDCQEQFSKCKPLVQLLERLPWPLMLQTSSGEVLSHNPAWWEQLGTLKDPDGVRKQVETILATTKPQSSEYSTTATVTNGILCDKTPAFDNLSSSSQTGKRASTSKRGKATKLETNSPQNRQNLQNLQQNPIEQEPLTVVSANYCFLDSQSGSCTCVVEVQNGQERIWQFAKIPLNSENEEVSIISNNIRSSANKCDSDDLWLVLATDVTEQQQLCKELAAKNADLMQLNRLKDEFLACISHELKTPLTAVLGLSRLLADRQLGELNERQARYAGLIHQSGRHLMSVVNDILDLTRMETGQMELTLSPVKIRPVCDRAIAEAKLIHTETKRVNVATKNKSENSRTEHKLNIEIEPGLEEIIADDLRLRQMLVHLLSNAFKFTETEGEIGLRVSRWEGWVAFTIWDTGIGIPEHQQHLIFQKFQQLENPLTRQYEGTGLGLVLTRALARLHGGDVSFLSSEHKGSQFTLLLPPCPPQESGRLGQEGQEENSSKYTRISKKSNKITSFSSSPLPLSTSPSPVSTSSHRLVLVVEAVARYIEDLTEHLTGLGYRVVIARSGCEAVEKARRLQPKAIFLNPLLPLLSGWDVLTLLKSDASCRHIPVVITATAAEKQQAFSNRADGFIPLPVQHQTLVPLLENLCAATESAQSFSQNHNERIQRQNPLRILRIVNPLLETFRSYHLLRDHRVVEVDNLEQADLLARVWQFDVLLLDPEVKASSNYLKKLSQQRRLASIPLVTCDVETTQSASQVPGLTVFPCLTPIGIDEEKSSGDKDALLSVLQIAAGMCCPPSILVVDLAILPDLPGTRRTEIQKDIANTSLLNSSVTENKNTGLAKGKKPRGIARGSEWFQALLQYLQTAGLKAAMPRTWTEMLQQIRHQSVDLILICLEESQVEEQVLAALTKLGELPFELPPILVLEQPSNSQNHIVQRKTTLESVQKVVHTYATEILPRSISMEELLNHINYALPKI
jgi:signal transduction histidine kinase/FixJ family two-component response regulator